MKKLTVYCFLNLLMLSAFAQPLQTNQLPAAPIQVNGVFPGLSVVGVHEGRSETGIGALMVWANKLWMVSYVAHISGGGAGLYEINDDMTMIRRPESVTGTYANRMVHDPSNQAIIGPHIIDSKGNVRTFQEIQGHRLTATMRHLFHPDSLVYFLTMEGLLFEANVYSLKTKLVCDVVETLYHQSVKELYNKGIYTHFKGGYTGNGRVIVGNNAYQEGDYTGKVHGGRLAEWDGKTWTLLDSTAYIEINGKQSSQFGNKPIYGDGIWATGWDRASAKLMFFSPESGKWRTYRLPKGSQAWEHAWNTEWMRIREAQTERYMMDLFGIMYELPVMVYGGNMMPIKPVCNHLRVIPDFITWRGLLVLSGDQTDNSIGQPQSNLQFTAIDELWKWGKPSGWGAVWREENLKANQISDPSLMNGFDKKVVHFTHQSDHSVHFKMEVDLLGNNQWVTYQTITVPSNGYAFHTFPDAYSAQWIRITVLEDTNHATVQFVYQ
jgi:hypothetical protein